MDEEGTYAPQSPDLSAFQSSLPPQQPVNSYYIPQQQPQQYQVPFAQSAVYRPIPYGFQQNTNSYHPPAMEHNGQSPGWTDDGDREWQPEYSSAGSGHKPKRQKLEPPNNKPAPCDKLAPGVEEGIEVKTKFPVARIKRIMQADEDVGKVAQVTPTAVSKALELFMISIVTKAAKEAQAKSSKRVTAAHLKQACERDEQWDFLASIMEKVPDATQGKKDEDSEETGDGRRKKSGTRRRKRNSDE